MNLLFALVCMPLLYMIGIQSPAYLDEIPKLRDVAQGGIAEKIGLQANDQILAVYGSEVLNWRSVNQEIGKGLSNSRLNLEVERKGALLNFEIPLQELQQQRQMGWKPFITPRAGGFTSTSPAKEAGLREGDLILSINGNSVRDWSDLIPLIQESQKQNQENPSETAEKIVVEFERSGDVQFAEMMPYFEKEAGLWLMGMSMPTMNKNYGIQESLSMGLQRVWQLTRATFQFLGQMLSGQGSMDDLGGPIRIGMVLGDAAKSGISNLIFLMAFISLQLGIFNLLPIPALDGGHILLLGFEKLKGAPLSTIFRERTQMIGFSVLIALMLFVTWNDLIQLFQA
jgi:regulator of sigma E protease